MESHSDGDRVAAIAAEIDVEAVPDKPSVSPNLLVAAIDFGTAYSGYAFLSREDFTTDDFKITTPDWDDNKDLKSSKTPTSILFDGKNKVVAFGNDAEKRFTELTEDDAHEEYYFFQKFKMLLYESVFQKDKVINNVYDVYML